MGESPRRCSAVRVDGAPRVPTWSRADPTGAPTRRCLLKWSTGRPKVGGVDDVGRPAGSPRPGPAPCRHAERGMPAGVREPRTIEGQAYRRDPNRRGPPVSGMTVRAFHARAISAFRLAAVSVSAHPPSDRNGSDMTEKVGRTDRGVRPYPCSSIRHRACRASRDPHGLADDRPGRATRRRYHRTGPSWFRLAGSGGGRSAPR